MGRLIILHDAMQPEMSEETEYCGRYIDFLESRWPDGFPTLHNQTRLNGKPVNIEDYEFEIGADDTVILAFSPGGLTPIEWIYLIVAIVSVGFSLAYRPSFNTPKTAEAAGSVYSVGATANQAKLGGIIPVGAGEFQRTPEYASQSYRQFIDNKEVRHFMFVVGVGDYEVDELYIGETPLSNLPDSLYSYARFTPAEHANTLGVIQAATGIHENVVTAVEVDSQELQSGGGSLFVTGADIAIVDGFKIGVGPHQFSSRFKSGDTFQVTDGANAGDYELTSVTQLYYPSHIVIIEVSPAFPFPDSNLTEFRYLKGESGASPGPFVTNPPGTQTDLLEFDIELPGGLFEQNADGSLGGLSINVQFEIQEIDDDGLTVGDPVYENYSIAESTNTPIRRTIPYQVAAGRYAVSVARTDSNSLSSKKVTRTLWTGLKAYLLHDAEADAYSRTTICTLTLTGAEAISASAQQQIKVRARRALTIDGVSTITDNPADILTDIYTDTVYGGGRPASEIVAADIAAWKVKRAGKPGFNGVFDTQTTLWAALKTVAAVGYAEPEPVNTGLSVIVDDIRPTRASMITPANLIRGGWKASWSFLRDGEHDGVQVEYRDPVTFAVAYALYPAAALDPDDVQVIGIADSAQALDMAKFLWRQRTMRNLSFEAQLEFDALNFARMDRIAAPIPMLNWGRAGQVMAVSGQTLTLDKPVPAGSVYCVLRSAEGGASDVMTGVGDGVKSITLDASLPFDVQTDGAAVRTLVAYGATGENIQDLLVRSIEPSGNRVKIRAVNYNADFYEGLS